MIPYWLVSDREKAGLGWLLRAYGVLILLAVISYFALEAAHARGRLSISLFDPGIPVYLALIAALAGVPVMNSCSQVVARYPQRQALPLLLLILAVSIGVVIALQVLLSRVLPSAIGVLLQYGMFGGIALWALGTRVRALMNKVKGRRD